MPHDSTHSIGIKEKYDCLRELYVMQTLPTQHAIVLNGLELLLYVVFMIILM